MTVVQELECKSQSTRFGRQFARQIGIFARQIDGNYPKNLKIWDFRPPVTPKFSRGRSLVRVNHLAACKITSLRALPATTIQLSSSTIKTKLSIATEREIQPRLDAQRMQFTTLGTWVLPSSRSHGIKKTGSRHEWRAWLLPTGRTNPSNHTGIDPRESSTSGLAPSHHLQEIFRVFGEREFSSSL